MGNNTQRASKKYLRIYSDIWVRKVWHIRGGEKVVHQSVPVARQYAISAGYAGIRIEFKKWEE
jgi:hypothetical protein